jgi:hypothetical protein
MHLSDISKTEFLRVFVISLLLPSELSKIVYPFIELNPMTIFPLSTKAHPKVSAAPQLLSVSNSTRVILGTNQESAMVSDQFVSTFCFHDKISHPVSVKKDIYNGTLYLVDANMKVFKYSGEKNLLYEIRPFSETTLSLKPADWGIYDGKVFFVGPSKNYLISYSEEGIPTILDCSATFSALSVEIIGCQLKFGIESPDRRENSIGPIRMRGNSVSLIFNAFPKEFQSNTRCDEFSDFISDDLLFYRVSNSSERYYFVKRKEKIYDYVFVFKESRTASIRTCFCAGNVVYLLNGTEIKSFYICF